MAKSNKITTQGRELRIKSCLDCKGKPVEEPYSAPPFTGMKCSICWEILSQFKEGVAVVLKEKKARVKREPKAKSKILKVQLEGFVIEKSDENDNIIIID